MADKNPLLDFVKGVLTVPLSIIGFVLFFGGLAAFSIRLSNNFFWTQLFMGLFGLIVGEVIFFVLYKAWEKEIKQLFNH